MKTHFLLGSRTHQKKTQDAITKHNLPQVFHLAVSDKIGGLLALDQEPKTLRDLYNILREVYGGKIGWEYMHIADSERQLWLRKRIETPDTRRMTIDHGEVFHWLARGELFEKFLQIKFTNVKRFGLDGSEVLIPGMVEMLEKSSDLGVDNVVMGMAHRGRLNVLANICGKKFGAIFGEFQGGKVEELEFGSGDVKYHLGLSEKRKMRNGKTLNISLAANPSHLECVNPVVMGKTRAKQKFTKDADRSKTLSVLIHGDASFSGQGVCFEAMGLNDLTRYTVGGTIHIVINNQIGFTTDPASSRSTPYCSDLGKTFNAPVFHVNADATEEVIRVFKLAAEWRAKFKSDVVIDLICYRRFGHNESDEPAFTQPLMYKKINAHPTQMTIYADHLVEKGLMTRKEVGEGIERVNSLLKDEYKKIEEYVHKGRSPRAEWLESFWTGFKSPTQQARNTGTAVTREQLQELSGELNTVPSNFTLHPSVQRQLETRHKTVVSGEGIDWSTAEQLAFATLLVDGNYIRLSGQDVERGTFSQRHASLHDQITGQKLTPLQTLPQSTATCTIVNSSLSEFGVLGYELGYSMEAPNQLVIWEAQFGDFANTAQVIFDQFIAAGEVKWYRQSGLVVNLPHGYDGQGPEHSSGRIERFLQMTNEPEEDPDMDSVTAIQKCNWQVVYPSTPAQYFHALRRQLHRDFRKPMILFFAKSTLRAPNVSSMQDFEAPSEFLNVLEDNVVEPETVRRVIFCSGQIWFALNAHREKLGVTDVALVRMEQIAPFPWAEMKENIRKYPASAEIQWCQEEPRNMGSYLFSEVRIENILETMGDARTLKYNGRIASAATATGLKQLHDIEHAKILADAFAA